jgi:CRP/FNR family transcriptional regulator, cyclic AMP receptor protein
VQGGIQLTIKMSQQQIGSLIGASRESINKHLGEWTRAGYLAAEGGFIVILDRVMLERIIEADG